MMAEVYQALRLDFQKPRGKHIGQSLGEGGDKGFKTSLTLLIVDDCKDLLHILGKCIAVYADGYNILTACGAEEAIEVLRSIPVDVLLTDLYMPGMNGFDLAAFTKKHYPSTRMIAMSGEDRNIPQDQINNLGISAVIKKPFNIDRLMSVVMDRAA